VSSYARLIVISLVRTTWLRSDFPTGTEQALVISPLRASSAANSSRPCRHQRGLRSRACSVAPGIGIDAVPVASRICSAPLAPGRARPACASTRGRKLRRLPRRPPARHPPCCQYHRLRVGQRSRLCRGLARGGRQTVSLGQLADVFQPRERHAENDAATERPRARHRGVPDHNGAGKSARSCQQVQSATTSGQPLAKDAR
jgi:hypothetical protein